MKVLIFIGLVLLLCRCSNTKVTKEVDLKPHYQIDLSDTNVFNSPYIK